jgi:hypothetical protein
MKLNLNIFKNQIEFFIYIFLKKINDIYLGLSFEGGC